MAIHTYLYDETYDPAMPTVDVQIISPDSQRRSVIAQALIDSGSDGTTVPVTLLDEIGVLSIGTAVMSGIWGQQRRVNTYLVSLKVGSHFLRGIHVAGVPATVGFILGRNALNQLAITLNGPANMVEIPTNK